MMRFVVDCSVVMSWCFEDESDEYSDRILELLADAQATVPAIWPLEVANVLLAGEKRKRLSAADSARFIELLDELPIYVDSETPDRAMKEIMSVGREQALSSYDAAYLELAMREGIPLASKDKELCAASVRCGVKILSPKYNRP